MTDKLLILIQSDSQDSAIAFIHLLEAAIDPGSLSLQFVSVVKNSVGDTTLLVSSALLAADLIDLTNIDESTDYLADNRQKADQKIKLRGHNQAQYIAQLVSNKSMSETMAWLRTQFPDSLELCSCQSITEAYRQFITGEYDFVFWGDSEDSECSEIFVMAKKQSQIILQLLELFPGLSEVSFDYPIDLYCVYLIS